MKSMLEHLSQYAFYHQDRRNVVTHFVGVSMIVIGIAILLFRPHFSLVGMTLTPAILVAAASAIFYLSLDKIIGLAMAVLLVLSILFAEFMAVQSTGLWLASGVGLFVVGWIIQFIGHFFEGKKPAFLDDITGLIIGPLFVFVEVLFLLGMKQDWQTHIHQYCMQKNSEMSE